MNVPQQSKETETDFQRRVDALDWEGAEESLSERGYAVTSPLLTAAECADLVSLYGDEKRFRSHIIMERYRFGIGDYKYFDNPLPQTVASLRTSAYTHLAPVANRWAELLGERGTHARFPLGHAEFSNLCHKAGQKKPTPLMLHYEAGGYNCLHQDLYGEVSFPLQVVFLLGQAGHDWEGGEFILVEQQPRAQSVGHSIRLEQGEAVVITTRYRPVKGARGYYRTNFRHGVSPLLTGERYTLGIIFHDAN